MPDPVPLPAGDRGAEAQGRARNPWAWIPTLYLAEGLLIGRDPGCQIVLASREVSREHALIAPSLLGYMITDRSLNGVLVNGWQDEAELRKTERTGIFGRT